MAVNVLCLVTHTDCENKWRSIEAAGHSVRVEQYDNRAHDRHGELVDLAKGLAPDAIVFIGAVERYHGRPVIRSDVHRALRDVAPYIHMCNDAADPPWWPDLEEYNRLGCFDVQVSIDGSRATPLAEFDEGIVKLTPIDHRPFEPRPWAERNRGMILIGGRGINQRGGFVGEMCARGMTFLPGPDGRSYEQFAAEMCDARVAFNFPESGSGQVSHVKGRVVEAGFAGCVLLERVGSPTADWFERGVDYLEYTDPDSARAAAEGADPEMARRFHDRVVREHHPAVFWKDVFGRAMSGR